MGDAENALPPSKKRAAGRELSRDTPIDDDEEDTPDFDAGTFKRASDDVLATRRIVKVRRQQSNSAPSSNPFAGIRLVTPTESSAKPTEATTETQLAGKNTIAYDSKGSGDSAVDSEKAKDEETKQPESKTREVEDKTAANKDAAEESNAEKENLEVNSEQSKDESKIGNENKKDAADKEIPPSKKRAAGRELSRDTPIDDDEEDTPDLDAGTFKRASDDVLATRRIVKVRRQQTNSAPSANPFAGIRLVTPTESSAKPTEATTETQLAGKNTIADDSKGSGDSAVDSEKAKDEETKQPESKTREVEDKTATNKDAAEESNAEKENLEVNNEQSKDDSKIRNENKKDATAKENARELAKESPKEEKGAENDDKKDDTENKDKVDNKASEEPSAEGDNLNSFQKLSSSQNAFTGFAGSGFSSSSFSFGTMSNEGSGFGSGSGSIFGIKNDKPDGLGFGSGSGPKFGLGLSNSGSSIFGTSGATAVSKSDGSRLSTLKEVVIETGEENEKVVFNADSVLFEFVDGGWKERGKGELKVNETSGTEKKARLLMRSKGNYRLILNARLYPEMKLTDMEKKGVTFACINSATEGKDSLSTFALKFKDGSIVEEFRAAITAHKGEALKTPES